MSDGSSPIARAYLMLYCSLGTLAEENLRAFAMDLEGEAFLECNKFQGRGSSFHSPFFAFEVGFKQAEYDYDQLISGIGGLFDAINRNKSKINDLLLMDDVMVILAINFNCQNADQKPAFDLSNEQLKTLGEIRASLSLDSYLAF